MKAVAVKFFCDVCETRPAAFTLPDMKGDYISFCVACAEIMFQRAMEEKQQSMIH